MALNFGVKNSLFTQSEQNDEGLNKSQSKSLTWGSEGFEFITITPAVDDVIHSDEGYLSSNSDNVFCMLGVKLPQGATIIDAVVYGTFATTNNWSLWRGPYDESPAIMVKIGEGARNTIGKINHIIDNDVESYSFFVRLYTNEQIDHAIIHYTI